MKEDRAVFITLSRSDVQIRHIYPMALPLMLAHLHPLVIAAMARMDLAEGLHRQEEDKFKVGHPAHQRAPLQRSYETLSRRASPQRDLP